MSAQNRELAAILDAGALLLRHGAEVNRIEDTIDRLCRAYGYTDVHVFCITSTIIVTAITAEGDTRTQIRRIKERDTNLRKVELVNALSRRLCREPVLAEVFEEEIAQIRDARQLPSWVNLVMYMAISATLSVFFGGTVDDGIAAALSGVVLYLTLRLSTRLAMNNLIQSMICSAVTAAAVLGLIHLGIGVHSDLIMIGNIMLVIPGIQLTNSLRDMINGDLISGLLNMSEAILKSIAVACGFTMVLIWGGGL